MSPEWKVTVAQPEDQRLGLHVYARTEVGPYGGPMTLAFTPDDADELAHRLIDAAQEARA